MKMTSRLNTKKKKSKTISAAIIIVLFFIAVVYRDKSFHLIEPFLKIRNKFEARYQEYLLLFEEKKNLQEENYFLRQKISKLEAENMLSLKSEEEDGLSKKFLTAGVIFRPPFTPYDMLVIDAGQNQGVKQGMQVSVFGAVLLGYATDVFDNSSKVKMISSWGEETNVVLESGFPAVAVGKGGENFEIILPRAAAVKVGEKITTLGVSPLLVGVVEKIEHRATDPFQKIFFRLPLNIQHLQRVFLPR
jgi:cell shape-determining protein MreC